MATLREKLAGYVNRDHVHRNDKYVGEAMDDVASQVAAVMRQGNFTAKGSPAPPSKPASLSVSSVNGLVTATIQHPDAPAGTQWVLRYSTSPTFQNAITETLSHPVWQRYLPQQSIFFKVTAKFPASSESDPIYFGTSVSPTQVSTGIVQTS